MKVFIASQENFKFVNAKFDIIRDLSMRSASPVSNPKSKRMGAPFWLPKSLAIQCQCEFGTLGTTTKVKVVSLVMRVIVCCTKKFVESIFALSTSTNRD